MNTSNSISQLLFFGRKCFNLRMVPVYLLVSLFDIYRSLLKGLFAKEILCAWQQPFVRRRSKS